MVIRRKVKQVIDGDTFIVSRKIGKTNVVRLAGINAPETFCVPQRYLLLNK